MFFACFELINTKDTNYILRGRLCKQWKPTDMSLLTSVLFDLTSDLALNHLRTIVTRPIKCKAIISMYTFQLTEYTVIDVAVPILLLDHPRDTVHTSLDCNKGACTHSECVCLDASANWNNWFMASENSNELLIMASWTCLYGICITIMVLNEWKITFTVSVD